MKPYRLILFKIVELEKKLKDKRQVIKNSGGQNLDLINEPLFNQAQALRWALDIGLDEELDEIDIGVMA